MKTINLDHWLTKTILTILIASGVWLLVQILSGCGAEIRPIQNYQPRSAPACCSAKSCKGMHR